MRSIIFVGLALSASALVVACSGSDATPSTNGSEGQSQDTNEPSNSSGSSSSGGTKSTSGSSGGSSSGGSTSSSSSGGADAGHDSAASSGGKAALGATCKADSDCASDVCFQGGSQSYCSLKCTSGNASTVCAAPTFNGTCNKQGYCRLP